MKMILSNKTKLITGIFICLIFLLVIALNVSSYFLNLKVINEFKTMADTTKFEVRSRLLMDAMNDVGVCAPEKATEVWAKGLMVRSAALQYSVMTKKLKDEYEKQLENSFPNWVTGISSPFVDSFKITKIEKPDENTYIFHLLISTKTSTGPAGDFNAVLTVTREGDFWRIIKIETDKELAVYTGWTIT